MNSWKSTEPSAWRPPVRGVDCGGRVRHRQRYSKCGVGAQARLVGRAVQLDEGAVQGLLVVRAHACYGRRDDLVDVGDGLEHALAAVTLWVAVPGGAVAELQRLVDAGGRAGGD